YNKEYHDHEEIIKNRKVINEYKKSIRLLNKRLKITENKMKSLQTKFNNE
ncbi:6578_t:CDS:1, partial [Scutellospora calospora]